MPRARPDTGALAVRGTRLPQHTQIIVGIKLIIVISRPTQPAYSSDGNQRPNTRGRSVYTSKPFPSAGTNARSRDMLYIGEVSWSRE